MVWYSISIWIKWALHMWIRAGIDGDKGVQTLCMCGREGRGQGWLLKYMQHDGTHWKTTHSQCSRWLPAFGVHCFNGPPLRIVCLHLLHIITVVAAHSHPHQHSVIPLHLSPLSCDVTHMQALQCAHYSNSIISRWEWIIGYISLACCMCQPQCAVAWTPSWCMLIMFVPCIHLPQCTGMGREGYHCRLQSKCSGSSPFQVEGTRTHLVQ